MYRTVLFDFDGTLIPSLEFWLEGFKHAFDTLGKDVPESRIIEGCFYRDDKELVEEFGIECSRTFWDLVTNRVSLSYDTPVMFPGARKVLAHCTDNNIAVGMVTSADRSFIEKAMGVLDIEHHFQAIVTGSDVTNFKPHPEPVLMALSQLGASAEDTLFVGDYVVDVKAGKAAGTHTALFFTEDHKRFHRFEHLEATEPTFIFSDYSELLQKLSVKAPVLDR